MWYFLTAVAACIIGAIIGAIVGFDIGQTEPKQPSFASPSAEKEYQAELLRRTDDFVGMGFDPKTALGKAQAALRKDAERAEKEMSNG